MNGSYRMLVESGRDTSAVDEWKSPWVEFDLLGEHLGAHASTVAGDRVEDQLQPPLTHARPTSLLVTFRPAPGKTRAALVWAQDP